MSDSEAGIVLAVCLALLVVTWLVFWWNSTDREQSELAARRRVLRELERRDG